MGSAAELEHHLMLARDLQLVSPEAARDYLNDTTEIQRMLYGLRTRVRF